MKKTRMRLNAWFFVLCFLSVFVTPQQVVGRSSDNGNDPVMVKAFENAATPDDYNAFIEKYKTDELAFVALQRLAKPFIEKEDWQAAVAVFSENKGKFPGMISRINKIINLLEAPDENLVIKNLGPGINTERGEYSPVLSASGKTIFFSRDLGVAGGEDVFVSSLIDGAWSDAINFGKPISSRRHEAPLSVSTDGNTLVLHGNYPGSLGKGDIFYCNRNGACWSDPKPYPPPVNSEYYDSSAMLTADGKSLFFVSTRPGAVGDYHEKDEFFHGNYHGNTDIYVYTKKKNGDFEAINLGKTINTPYSEYSPFLHSDGKTLYFSSDGHYGLGGLDVFMSKRLDDSWTNWSMPVNLGKNINGPGNDWGYQIATEGDVSFFSVSGNPESFGGNDIYSISLPEQVKPLPVTTVAGKVTDPSGNSLSVAIKWYDLTLNQEAGIATSEPVSGEYFIVMPAGHMFSFYAVKDNFIGESGTIDLTDKADFAAYTKDIVLYPIEQLTAQAENVEVRIQVNNIFFDFNKFELKKESFIELDRWIEVLAKHTEIIPEIHGHTDNVGTDDYNMKLSVKRAQAVADYLIEKGIDPLRVNVKGFGESQPVATNDSEEGRTQNRRVEFKFGGNDAQD